MGYRSDVRIRLTDEGYERLQKFVKVGMEQINLERRMNHECELGNVLDEADFVVRNSDTAYIGWNDIKWYDCPQFDDCADITIVSRGLQALEKDDIPYRFSRIGEDYTDIEEVVSNTSHEGDLDYIQITRKFDDDANAGCC